MSSLFLHVNKLIERSDRSPKINDFVDPMLKGPHKELALVETVKSIESCV